MSIKTDYLLKGLHVISWIIFIGVCIDAGGVITNGLYSIFINPELANHFWNKVDLSKVYTFNNVSFVTLISLMCIVTTLKAILFYIIIKIFHNKKFDLSNPFNDTLEKFIFNIAYCSFGIGFFSKWGGDLIEWLMSKQVVMPAVQHLKMGGSDVWLLMGFVVFVFAKIFKKGIELQSETDLTV